MASRESRTRARPSTSTSTTSCTCLASCSTWAPGSTSLATRSRLKGFRPRCCGRRGTWGRRTSMSLECMRDRVCRGSAATWYVLYDCNLLVIASRSRWKPWMARIQMRECTVELAEGSDLLRVRFDMSNKSSVQVQDETRLHELPFTSHAARSHEGMRWSSPWKARRDGEHRTPTR